MLGSVGQHLDDRAPRQAALPLDVLREGLKALLERLAGSSANPKPDRADDRESWMPVQPEPRPGSDCAD
ncbi:hypothetical protein AB0D94_19690 [Streptomyces sp. NPDC048255]|uniref:hypothetical protein n=1 Tax=Streptomyces sp. NPDC048255 TaxID=3154713 RepID=UPI0033F18894